VSISYLQGTGRQVGIVVVGRLLTAVDDAINVNVGFKQFVMYAAMNPL